ncbi:acyl-CoA desaturase 3-like [Ctenocephalides felis]|uniref:acyl-CoA desaturase 3-like n=1 Tax=Ctenocephalides felis TaxID=7515 RepID=UPI000E6E424A|nr:acyl-CoA desaturase 3-like [Ctenocephalides felis]
MSMHINVALLVKELKQQIVNNTVRWYFWVLKFLFCFIIPTVIPVYCWGEEWYFSFCVQCLIRYACSLNFTWSVNSFAHLYGHRPYDNRINPVENKLVSFFAMGEGWHNYHHVFPWDYKAAEMPYTINITTVWLDVFAKLGWAYDMKQPSKELVKNVAIKHGDGSHSTWGHKEVPPPQEQKIRELVDDDRQH